MLSKLSVKRTVFCPVRARARAADGALDVGHGLCDAVVEAHEVGDLVARVDDGGMIPPAHHFADGDERHGEHVAHQIDADLAGADEVLPLALARDVALFQGKIVGSRAKDALGRHFFLRVAFAHALLKGEGGKFQADGFFVQLARKDDGIEPPFKGAHVVVGVPHEEGEHVVGDDVLLFERLAL